MATLRSYMDLSKNGRYSTQNRRYPHSLMRQIEHQKLYQRSDYEKIIFYIWTSFNLFA